MAVGIVIPAYNASPFLAQTIEGVLSQTEVDWRLIVVDDGSSDDTPHIAEAYARVDRRIAVTRQTNSGTACARNTGAAALAPASEYVMFLDHDDVLMPAALELLLAAVVSSPSAVGAHGLARKVDARGNPVGEGDAGIQNYHRKKLIDGRPVHSSREECTTAAMVIYDNLIPTPGVALIRKNALDKLTESGRPLFDPSAAPLDDWDFWLRLTRIGDMAFIDRVVLDWRRHERAGSLDVAAMSAAGMRIRERLAKENLPPEIAAVAEHRYRRLVATERRRAARELFRAGKWPQSAREYAAYVRLRIVMEREGQ